MKAKPIYFGVFVALGIVLLVKPTNRAVLVPQAGPKPALPIQPTAGASHAWPTTLIQGHGYAATARVPTGLGWLVGTGTIASAVEDRISVRPSVVSLGDNRYLVWGIWTKPTGPRPRLPAEVENFWEYASSGV